MMSISPPRLKGPPLNALRAFEAAARLGGFIPAADELCVTPGAIAQHIKSVELWAGVPLFERHPNGVILTQQGEKILPLFSQAFDTLGLAIQSLRSQTSPQMIRIAALPSIAQLWLSSRLPYIRNKFPDMEISVTALENPPNLNREPYDLSIFFNDPKDEHKSEFVAQDIIYPVCSPTIARRLSTPSDLALVPCIQDATWSDDWKQWIAASYPDADIKIQGPVFSLYALALEEVINGAGVLMGHLSLIQDHLNSGRLVAPFKNQLLLNRHLSIQRAETRNSDPTLTTIISALKNQ